MAKVMESYKVAVVSFNPKGLTVHRFNPGYRPPNGRVPCVSFTNEDNLKALGTQDFFGVLLTQHLTIKEGDEVMLVYNPLNPGAEIQLSLNGVPQNDLRKYWFAHKGGPNFYDLVEGRSDRQPTGSNSTLYWLEKTQKFFCDTCGKDFGPYQEQKKVDLCQECVAEKAKRELESKLGVERSILGKLKVVQSVGEPPAETPVGAALKQAMEVAEKASATVPSEEPNPAPTAKPTTRATKAAAEQQQLATAAA